MNAAKNASDDPVRLNEPAYKHAMNLILSGKFVLDSRDDWSEHQPTAAQENKYIEKHGISAYSKWHLGVDIREKEDTKARYKFPYGDFQKVHRCAILAAESRAGQYKHFDIEQAAAHLHGMLNTSADKK